jgi:cell division protein FtsN
MEEIMGDTHLPSPEAASYELALANRKLVTVVMGMTLLMGLVACLAYLAGRSVTGIRAEQAAPRALPPPVVVERSPAPVTPSVAQAAPAPVPPPAAPVPVPAPVVSAPAPAAATAPSGQRLFLQVAAGEVSDFQPLRSELEKAGFPTEVVRLDNKHRLLVGPIQDPAQKQEFESRLTASGHAFFARKL